MPESKCTHCQEVYWSPDMDGLKKWELQHHIDSYVKSHPQSQAFVSGLEGTHTCQGFFVYNEGSSRINKTRTYNHGELREEVVIIP